MPRTKGAIGRSQEDSVQSLRQVTQEVALKAQEKGCRACGELRDLIAVPLMGHGDLPGFSRLPYQKGMTLRELKEQALLYRWVCRKCLRGVMYPPEWAEKKKDVPPLDLSDERNFAAGLWHGIGILLELTSGESEEITHRGTVLWRRVGRIVE